MLFFRPRLIIFLKFQKNFSLDILIKYILIKKKECMTSLHSVLRGGAWELLTNIQTRSVQERAAGDLM